MPVFSVRTMFAAGIAIAVAAGPAVAANSTIITEADNGKAVAVPAGQPLEVQLPGTNGTGYWVLDSDLTPQLSLSGRVTHSVKQAGAPETTIYYFRPHLPGTVALKAHYVRTAPGEAHSGTDGKETFAVILTVAEALPALGS
jgi:predicted secreted protein